MARPQGGTWLSWGSSSHKAGNKGRSVIGWAHGLPRAGVVDLSKQALLWPGSRAMSRHQSLFVMIPDLEKISSRGRKEDRERIMPCGQRAVIYHSLLYSRYPCQIGCRGLRRVPWANFRAHKSSDDPCPDIFSIPAALNSGTPFIVTPPRPPRPLKGGSPKLLRRF